MKKREKEQQYNSAADNLAVIYAVSLPFPGKQNRALKDRSVTVIQMQTI